MVKTFWDSNLFIYLIEEDNNYFSKIESLLEYQENNDFEIITSTLSLGEVLVKPYKEDRQELIKAYEAVFSEIELIPASKDVTREFARLRAKNNVKSPDALQVASAIIGGAGIFITNDERLSKVSSPDLQIYSLDSFIKKFITP